MIYGDIPNILPHGAIYPSVIALTHSGNLYMYCLNNPFIYVDKDGKIPVLVVTMGLGALIGGVISAGANIATQAIVGGGLSNVNWKEVGVSALSGAASGALAGSGIGLAGVVAGNAAIGAASYAATQAVNNRNITVSGLATNAVMSGALGALGGSGKETVKVLRNLQGGINYQNAMMALRQAITGNAGQSASLDYFKTAFRHTVGSEVIFPSIWQGVRDEVIQAIADKFLEWGVISERTSEIDRTLWSAAACE